ncbi:hypothetical protein AACB27_00005, partial [Burkholderia contaminans]
SGNSLFTMMQMLAMGLGVSIGGGLVNLFAAYWGSMAHGFMLSFTCMGVVTLLSSVVFRRIDTAAAPARRPRARPRERGRQFAGRRSTTRLSTQRIDEPSAGGCATRYSSISSVYR